TDPAAKQLHLLSKLLTGSFARAFGQQFTSSLIQRNLRSHRWLDRRRVELHRDRRFDRHNRNAMILDQQNGQTIVELELTWRRKRQRTCRTSRRRMIAPLLRLQLTQDCRRGLNRNQRERQRGRKQKAKHEAKSRGVHCSPPFSPAGFSFETSMRSTAVFARVI